MSRFTEGADHRRVARTGDGLQAADLPTFYRNYRISPAPIYLGRSARRVRVSEMCRLRRWSVKCSARIQAWRADRMIVGFVAASRHESRQKRGSLRLFLRLSELFQRIVPGTACIKAKRRVAGG